MRVAMRVLIVCLAATTVLSMDWIPVVSQCKSFVQWASGDSEGARQTAIRFTEQCPVVSQVTSAVHSATGNNEEARRVQLEQARFLEAAVTSIPVLGHVASGVAAAVGDEERAREYAVRATRSSVVIGGGLAGGPLGAAAAGVAYNASVSAIQSAATGESQVGGTLGSIIEAGRALANNDISAAGKVLDAVAGLAGDGLMGKGGATAVKNMASKAKNAIKGVPEAPSAPPAPGQAGLPANAPRGGNPTPTPGSTSGGAKAVSPFGAIVTETTKFAEAHPVTASSAGMSLQQRVADSPVEVPVQPQPQTLIASTEASADANVEASADASVNASAYASQEANGGGGDVGGHNAKGKQVARDADVPESSSTWVETEEMMGDEDEDREHINVMLTNSRLVSRSMPRAHEAILWAQLVFSVRRMHSLRRYFKTGTTTKDIGPDPIHGGKPRFPKPVEQSYACCNVVGEKDNRAVLTTYGKAPKGFKYGRETYCTMLGSGGSLSEGMSAGARARLMEVDRGELMWLGAGGMLFGETWDQANPDSLAVRQSDNVPQEQAGRGPLERCAEHQAAMHLFHHGETPITSMSFRLDAAGRVRSVPRCPNCAHFDFGFVLTDHIPEGTWLNAPHDLDVYI